MNLREILALDDRLSTRLRLRRQATPGFRVAAFFAHSGDSWFWLAGLGLVWLFGSPPARHNAALLIIGVVMLAVLVIGIKFSVRRRRPEGDWGAIYRNSDPHSFPSGHASRAAMLAVVAMGLGPLWFGVLLVIWAPMVSVSRVLTGVHYLSDVLAGTLLGILAGLAVLALHTPLVRYFPFLF